eukprot:5855282-Prymnesium_polylepis.1
MVRTRMGASHFSFGFAIETHVTRNEVRARPRGTPALPHGHRARPQGTTTRHGRTAARPHGRTAARPHGRTAARPQV